MQITVADITAQRIFLGWTGENKHVQFSYDFSGVFAEYPDAAVGLTIQPPMGDAYPHTITRDGDAVAWEVLASDCAIAGDGVYQFTFTQGEHVVKSFKGFFTVRESLTGSGEAPTPVANWIADAEAALFALTGMTARAETLAPDAEATATIVEENGRKVIVLGVPQGKQGEKGDVGATPRFTIGTVTTLPPTESATVTITGTPEDPVLNLGIPQGIQGVKGDKGDAFTYADFTPEQKAELVQGPIKEAQTEAVTAVNNAGTTQVKNVNDAGAAQVKAVQDKGQEVRESIPPDYSALTDDVNSLKSAINNCIVSKINLEQGGFTGTSGKQDNTKRIRLITPIFLPKGTQINLFVGDLCWLAWELSSSVTTGGNVIVSTGWNTEIEYTTRNDCWLMMAFATALTEQSSSAISVNDFSEKSINIVVPNKDVNEIKTYIDCGGAQITSSDFEQGEFTSDRGKVSGTKRIRLRSAIECKKLTEIKFPDNNLYYYIWFLSSDNLSTPSVIAKQGWGSYTELQVPADCYVYISVANALTYNLSTDIVPSDFEGTISFAENNYYLEKINDNVTRIDRITSNRRLLYISDVKQGGFSATDYTSSNQRICTKDCVALPYGEKTVLTVKMSPAIRDGVYLFAVRAGRTPQDLSSNKYWYKSGDTVTFTNHEQYYRIIFAIGYFDNYYYYYDIDPSDIEIMQPVVEYSYMDDGAVMDTLTANADNLQRLINSKNVLSASSHGGTTSRPVIFHISDLHGDRERAKNALDICKHCDGDAIIFSGDIVANRPVDGVGWMHKLFAGFGGTPILCVGNHEVTQEGITDEQVYEYFMQPSATKIGNANAKTYYYTDIASKQIRIISVDLYQYGATTRSNTHMTSEQLAYICSALKTTPTGYGVLIVSHTPCVDIGSRIDQNYPTFFQPLRKYGFTHYDIVGAPIYDIIDAFNSRTTISKTYEQTGSPSSISVSDDFSSVAASVEFIAHITGHIHEDSVCYLPTQTKQLMLNITCGCAMSGGSSYPYLADDCDITRIPYDKTQDAINAYVIDRVGKRVRIVRIGGTLTYDMQNREYMEIPYAD